MRDGMRLIALAALAWAPLDGAVHAAGPPPNGGTIAIEPRTASGDYDPAMHAFVDAAAAALAARGFTILDDTGHAAYVAELLVGRSEVGTGRVRVRGDKPSMAGAGVVVPLSTGKSQLVPLQRVRLQLRIHRRGDDATVWTGAAVTVREMGTRSGSPAAVATDLSQAVLRPYPAEPPVEVGVP